MIHRAVGCLTLLSWLAGALSGTAAEWTHGRVVVAPDGHHLQHADGTPFFWLGDTAWSLFHRLDRTEIAHYLDNRAAKGFNVIQAVALYSATTAAERVQPAVIGGLALLGLAYVGVRIYRGQGLVPQAWREALRRRWADPPP